MSEDSEAKTHPASRRKLKRQREDGIVPMGSEMAGYVGAAAGIGAAAFVLEGIPERIVRLLEAGLRLGDVPKEVMLRGAAETLMPELFDILAPVAGVAVAASVVALLVWNKGIPFSLKPTAPKLERVSPVSGLKRIYGRRGWVETGAGVLRVVIWGGASAAILATALPDLFRNPSCGTECQWFIVKPIPWALGAATVGVFLAAAVLDMILQRGLFLHEQRMTESELKRERKEQSGAPEIRRERSRRQREDRHSVGAIGAKRANMCFFDGERAVAIRYHSKKTPVPRLAAKAGTATEVAALRAAIRARGFPERNDPAIVAACYHLPPGGAVQLAHFEMLGAAIREMFEGYGST